MFRLATYNVHRCFGMGGRRDITADVLSICRDIDADLLALQELDAPEADDDNESEHKARDFAAALGMQLLFCRTLRRGVGTYGHALLSRRPIELRKATTLPSAHPGHEPRGAIWGSTSLPSGEPLHVVSTHLGIHGADRKAQALELVGPGWLASPEMQGARILCGDLNGVAGARTYRTLSRHLRDAQRALPGHRPLSTFPALLPVVRIDHVFVSEHLVVRAVHVPNDRRTRRASDHLPLVVDLTSA